MNIQKLKQKLSIKNAKLAVDYGYTLYKAVEIAQWLYVNIPW